MVGLAVDQVTVDFPQVNMSGALEAIRSAVPNDKFIQSCKVPLVAGGSVDILLGIQYASLFPKLVHMLPCGLGIYELELEAPGGGFNACIAGPHKTLAALSLEIGGTRNLLAHFTQGLESWRTLANKTPVLAQLPPNDEEIRFYKGLNLMEDDTGLVAALGMERDEECLDSDTFHSCTYLDSEDRLTLLKNKLPSEIPLDLDYRCVSCRNCSN